MIAGPTWTRARERISRVLSVKQAQEPRSDSQAGPSCGWRLTQGLCWLLFSRLTAFRKGISRVLLSARTAHQCLSSVSFCCHLLAESIRDTPEPFTSFGWLRFRGFLDPRALVSSRTKGKAVLSTLLAQEGWKHYPHVALRDGPPDTALQSCVSLLKRNRPSMWAWLVLASALLEEGNLWFVCFMKENWTPKPTSSFIILKDCLVLLATDPLRWVLTLPLVYSSEFLQSRPFPAHSLHPALELNTG